MFLQFVSSAGMWFKVLPQASWGNHETSPNSPWKFPFPLRPNIFRHGKKDRVWQALKRPAVPFARKKRNNKNLPEHIIAIEAVCLPCLQSLNLCTKYLLDSCWAHGELLGLTWGGRLCLRAVDSILDHAPFWNLQKNARQSHPHRASAKILR